MANPISTTNVISEAMAAPLGDLIAAVGRGLAEAQQSLDQTTLETIKALYAGQDAKLDLLRQLGWQPTWYRIPELSAELTLSLSVHGGSGTDGSGPGRVQLYVSTMDATYTNSFDYDLKAASVIKFKIVPVPPSAQADARKIVPAILQMKLGDAKLRLANFGIPFELANPKRNLLELDGNLEQVIGTIPAPGELLEAGQSVKLKLLSDPA